jgi:predicted transposase YdaD
MYQNNPVVPVNTPRLVSSNRLTSQLIHRKLPTKLRNVARTHRTVLNGRTIITWHRSRRPRPNPPSSRQTTHQFRVIRLWEEEAETLMNLPGLLPYAVLGKTNNREQVLRQVAQLIEQIPDAQQRSNLTAGAAIFAGLKLDQQLINQLFVS